MKTRGLGKLIEECGELVQILGKKLAYFHTDRHPDKKGSMKRRMEEEIADVRAASEFVIDENDLDRDFIEERTQMKLKKFRRWKKRNLI